MIVLPLLTSLTIQRMFPLDPYLTRTMCCVVSPTKRWRGTLSPLPLEPLMPGALKKTRPLTAFRVTTGVAGFRRMSWAVNLTVEFLQRPLGDGGRQDGAPMWKKRVDVETGAR